MSDQTRSTSRTDLNANGGMGSDVSELVGRSAKGDLEAQRYLRDCCADAFVHRTTVTPDHDLLAIQAILLARQCTAHGEYDDAERLAAILLNAGVRFGEWQRVELASGYAAEALSIYERMAVRGDNQAAGYVDQIVGLMPELVQRAKALTAMGGV